MKYLGIALALIIAFIWYTYNRLVTLSKLKEEAWSGIDVQLKRRADLIPNLVEVVKSYKDFEQETLSRVTQLRTQAQNSSSSKQRQELEQGIGAELKNVLAIVEAYPELKSSEQFLELHKQLIATEDDLQYARRYYNGTVRDLNISIEQFPANLFATNFGFRSEEFFEIEYATHRDLPDISF